MKCPVLGGDRSRLDSGRNEPVKNSEEAAKTVVAANTSGSASLPVQKRQMENLAKVISNANTPKIGHLDPAA